MSNDSGPNLPPFPSSYRASGLLLHVTSLPSSYGIGDGDQPRSPGSINFPMQGKAGGRRCHWARQVTQPKIRGAAGLIPLSTPAANDRLGFRPRLWNSTSGSLES